MCITQDLFIIVLRRAKALVDVILREPVFLLAFNSAEIHPVVANTIVITDLRLLSILFFTSMFALIASVA